LQSASRGEKLVQHLMAFVRRKPPNLEVINPGPVIAGLVEILNRSFPEMYVSGEIGDDLWPILVDQNQLESAILNLAINARDATQGRGRMTVVARNSHLQDGPDELGISGDFLAVAVSDDGPGMPAETLAQAFEPFFTTKGPGIGTGLGLSMVQDFAIQSGGKARIGSALGKGTAVTIYLPRYRGEAVLTLRE
jgi:signal transduction histidine kinase